MAEGGALRELLALFSVHVETEELEKADGRVDAFAKRLSRASTFIAEIFAAHEVKEFFSEQVENAAHLQDMAERLDVSAESIKEFGFAAKGAGIDLDSAAHALGFFELNLGKARLGGKEQAQAFSALGIQTKNAAGGARPLNDILGDVAEKFAELPDQQKRAAYAMQLFGREGRVLLPVLAQGREKLEELMGESRELGSGLGGDFYKNAKQVREEFEHFGYAVQSLKERALSAALPYLEKLGHFFTDSAKALVTFTKHTNVLSTGMLFLGGIAAWKLIGSLQSLAEVLGLLEAETLLPIAGLALLYLAFDDVYTLMTGGKSAIGDAIDELFGIGEAAKFAKDLSESVDAFTDSLENIGDIVYQTLVTPFEQALDAAKGVGEALGDIAGGHVGKAVEDLEKAGSVMSADFSKRQNATLGAVGGLGEDFTLSKEGRRQKRRDREIARATTKDYQAGGSEFQGPLPLAPEHAPIPGHGGPGRAVHVEHSVHNETHIDVHTASDKPREVARATGHEVDRVQKKNANNSLVALTEP